MGMIRLRYIKRTCRHCRLITQSLAVGEVNEICRNSMRFRWWKPPPEGNPWIDKGELWLTLHRRTMTYSFIMYGFRSARLDVELVIRLDCFNYGFQKNNTFTIKILIRIVFFQAIVCSITNNTRAHHYSWMCSKQAQSNGQVCMSELCKHSWYSYVLHVMEMWFSCAAI